MSKLDAARQLLVGRYPEASQKAIFETIEINSGARVIFDHALRVIAELIPDPRVITLSYKDGLFSFDERKLAGTPPVGYGRTMEEAMANWLRYWACEFGIVMRLDESAEPFEMIRRHKELSKR